MPDEPEVVVARGDRSGQSVRHDPEVAGARRGERRSGGPRRRRGRSARWWCSSTAPRRLHRRGARQLSVYLPEDEPARSSVGAGAGRAPGRAHAAGRQPAADPASARSTACRPSEHPLAEFLLDAGFSPVGDGLPDAAPCLKATPSSGPRAPCTARSAGKPVVRFESVLPALTRVHDDHPLTGRTSRRSAPSASTC